MCAYTHLANDATDGAANNNVNVLRHQFEQEPWRRELLEVQALVAGGCERRRLNAVNAVYGLYHPASQNTV